MNHAYLPLVLLSLFSIILATGCTQEDDLVFETPKGYAEPQAIYRRTWQENSKAYAALPTENVLFGAESEALPATKVEPVKKVSAPAKSQTKIAKAKRKAKRMTVASAKTRKARRAGIMNVSLNR